MIHSLVRVTDATIEPVSIDEAMEYLRVDDVERSVEIGRIIKSARQEVENFTGRALISQTWKLTQSAWPCVKAFNYARANSWAERTIELQRSPLLSVESVKYYPASGAALATLSSDAYSVLTGPTPGLVVLKSTESWPDIYDRPDAVEVNFTAGHGTTPDSVPPDLIDAMFLIIAERYEQRSRSITGTIHTELPAAKRLMESYRVNGWVA